VDEIVIYPALRVREYRLNGCDLDVLEAAGGAEFLGKNLCDSLSAWSLLLGVAAGLTACQKAAPSPASPPPAASDQTAPPPIFVDTSTPDRALKTIWAIQDQETRQRCQLAKDAISHPTSPNFLLLTGHFSHPELFTGAIDRSQADAAKSETRDCVEGGAFRREINDIHQETESRAVAAVTIWNILPIPPGAKEYAWEKTEREDGNKYKYVFTKVGPNWRLDDVLVSSSLVPEFKSYYSDPSPPYPSGTQPF
jgi:hypothetical protein